MNKFFAVPRYNIQQTNQYSLFYIYQYYMIDIISFESTDNPYDFAL